VLLAPSHFCMRCKVPFHSDKPFCDLTPAKFQTASNHICSDIQVSDENNLEEHVVNSHCRQFSSASSLGKRKQKWRARTSSARLDVSMKPFLRRNCSFCSCCLRVVVGRAGTRVCDRCCSHLPQRPPVHN